MPRFTVAFTLALSVAPLLGSAACGGASTPGAASGPAGDKYAILLQRELPVGKQYHLRVKDEATEHTVMRMDGKLLSDENKTTTFIFVGTQTAFSTGRAQPTDYVVEQLTQTKDEQTTTLLPPGTKLAAKAVGKSWEYSVDGTLVAEDLMKTLRTLLGHDAAGPTDDDIFGTKLPRALGESWPVDVSRFPSDDDVTFNPQGASGSTHLIARRKLAGIDCLEIQAEISVPSLTLNSLPPEAKLRAARVSGHFVGMFPIDGKLPSIEQAMSMDMAVQMEMPSPNGVVSGDITGHNEHSQSRE